MTKRTTKKWHLEIGKEEYLDGILSAFCIYEDVGRDDGAQRAVAYAFSKEDAHLLAAAPELLEALILATNELNIIRARDGAPQHIEWNRGRPLQSDGCAKEWWNDLTEQCFAAIRRATGDEA